MNARREAVEHWARALDAARLIMKAIHEMHPDVFPFDGRDDDQNEQNR